jgi:hypothetical protein
MLEKPVYSCRGHVSFGYAEAVPSPLELGNYAKRSICFSLGEFPGFLDCFAYWYSLLAVFPSEV